MAPIKVLVVDDSVLAREMLCAILSSDPDICIIGEAANGRAAVEKAEALRPDIVTMDLQMPVMNGLLALEEIMASNAVPVLVVSAQGDAGTAYSAVSKGALEVLSKSDIDPANPEELIRKIKLLSRVKVITHIRSASSKKDIWNSLKPGERTAGNQQKRETLPPGPRKGFKIVAIASSTGGPKALSELLPELPQEFPCPVVVAQHISDGFVSGMVDWLGKLSRIKVKVAQGGEPAMAGVVYISPSEKHMTIDRNQRIVLMERAPNDIHHPSCNTLLSSVASVCGSNSMGVILTGMGSDGVEGMANIKAAGGYTVAQDEKSCAIFGMPKVAIQRGCIDKVLSLSKIAAEILQWI